MASYAELSRNNPPSSLVRHAVELCRERDRALDLGAGSLRNTKYLLEQGFEVTAVDKDPILLEEAGKLGAQKLQPVVSTYIDFAFPESEYDVLVAMNSLPFEAPRAYPPLFRNIKKSLKSGGVLCMTFFGTNDDWANNPEMTFHTREDILELCRDLEMVSLEEVEEDTGTIQGTPKHWHLFRLLARR